MRESERQIDFETLIINVRDAVLEWEVNFFDTVPKILDGIESGRLKKDDYQIDYYIMGGVYDPKYGDFRMKMLIKQ